MRSPFLPGRLLAGAACMLALLGPSVASAAQQQATDPDSNTVFALDGTSLTITVAQAPAASLRVTATCVEGILSFEAFLDAFYSSKEFGSSNFALASAQADWPAGQTALTLTLPRDVSVGVDWCNLGPAGGSTTDRAGFTADGRAAIDGTAGKAQDTVAIASLRNAASAAAADRTARGRFATGTKLARLIRRYEPSLTVRVLKVRLNQAKQLQPGVVYVLKSSTTRRLELAALSRSGKLWILTYRNKVTINDFAPPS